MKNALKFLLLCVLAAPSLFAQNVSRMVNGVTTLTAGSPHSGTCAESLQLVVVNSASAYTYTLPTASTCPTGTVFQLKNIGLGTLTLSPSSGTVNGAASITLTTNMAVEVYDDGTNYTTQGGVGAVRAIGFAFGDANATSASALVVNQVGYLTVPFSCTIVGWAIMVDAGTLTIDVLKIATGTAVPTASITASATPAISTGTAIYSTTLTGWTTSVAAYDILGFKITVTNGTPKQATIQLFCAQ